MQDGNVIDDEKTNWNKTGSYRNAGGICQKIKSTEFTVLLRAETEGFEPSCPGGLTHFECAPL